LPGRMSLILFHCESLSMDIKPPLAGALYHNSYDKTSECPQNLGDPTRSYTRLA
jgi:hypothetical protein